jgi:hypothetical protein
MESREPRTDTPRSPYRRPQLSVYGQLQVVTQSNVSRNMNDKGNGSQTMT